MEILIEANTDEKHTIKLTENGVMINVESRTEGWRNGRVFIPDDLLTLYAEKFNLLCKLKGYTING